MNPILSKLLGKRKIDKVELLTPEERKDFDRWEKILSGGEINVDRIKDFIKSQLGLIRTKMKDLDNNEKKNDRLVTQHTVYASILEAIDAPTAERENLEKFLNQLIEAP